MTNYIIIANGTELDVYDDITISLNYQIDDILEVDKRNTNYSKTITIPGTPKNNKFFKHTFDVNIDNTYFFDPKKKIPAHIRSSDNEVMIGSLQLLNVIINNKEVQYEIVIAGSLKNIMDSLDNLKLRNIDMSEYNHERNRTNIQASWTYSAVSFDTLVNYGEPSHGYVYPYIVKSIINDPTYTVPISDMFPAPYVKTVWDKMFELIGYTYTSEFLNSEYFKKLILPFTGEKLQLSDEQVTAKTVRAGVDSSVSNFSVTPAQAEGDWWWYSSDVSYYIGYPTQYFTRESGTVTDTTGDLTFTDELGQWANSRFTCAEAGWYNIEYHGTMFPVVTRTDGTGSSYQVKNNNPINAKYRYQMYLLKAGGGSVILDTSPTSTSNPDGVIIFDVSDQVAHDTPWVDTATELPIDLNASNVYLEVGDEIVIRLGFRYEGGGNLWSTPSNDNKVRVGMAMARNISDNFSKMIVEPASNEANGIVDIDMNQMLPDMSTKEFFLNIVKMFNLVIIDNPNKEGDLIIEPRDDYFASKQKIKDWTYLLDNDSEVKITPMSDLDGRYFLYKYKDDDDYYNKKYTDDTGRSYGDLTVDSYNEFSNKTIKTELAFSPTPDSWKFQEYAGTSYPARVAPFFTNKEDDEHVPRAVKPRILFYGGVQDCGRWKMVDKYLGQLWYDPANQTILYEYPYCGMWDNPYDAKWDLGFGLTETIYWGAGSIPMSNLYDRFHKTTIDNITDANSRLMEANFYLTSKEIADFDFRDIIFIDGTYWRVYQIKNYDPADGEKLTKVILYKLHDVVRLSEFSIEAPTSNRPCPTDLVVVLGGTGGGGGLPDGGPKKQLEDAPSQSKRPYYSSQSGKPITADCCKALGGDWINGVCYYVRVVPNGGGGTDSGPKIKLDNILPAPSPTGPISESRNGNTKNVDGVKIYGVNNYVGISGQTRVIIGDGNSTSPLARNSIIIGDNIYAKNPNSVYIGNIVIDENGNIGTSGIAVIDGGEDEVFDLFKTNPIDIIDGGEDVVRAFGGYAKNRPIIDGNSTD